MMEEKWCEDCSHYTKPPNEEPCKSCTNHSNWGSAHVTIEQFNTLAEQVRELQEFMRGWAGNDGGITNQAAQKCAARLKPAEVEEKHELVECGHVGLEALGEWQTVYYGDWIICPTAAKPTADIVTGVDSDTGAPMFNPLETAHKPEQWVLARRSPENAAALKALEESNATA